jgi:antitoxin HigA-1
MRWLLNTLGAEVVHPGQVLLELYMRPYGVSQNALARQMGVSARRVNEIVQGKRAITAQTALRLAAIFGGDGMDWLERQALWDLHEARRQAGRRKGGPRRNRQRADRGRGHAPETARRGRVSREAARIAAERAFDAELQTYLKANKIGAYAPGYGLAVPAQPEAPSEKGSADLDDPPVPFQP